MRWLIIGYTVLWPIMHTSEGMDASALRTEKDLPLQMLLKLWDLQ